MFTVVEHDVDPFDHNILSVGSVQFNPKSFIDTVPVVPQRVISAGKVGEGVLFPANAHPSWIKIWSMAKSLPLLKFPPLVFHISKGLIPVGPV